MNQKTKLASALIIGDRISFYSGQADNFTGHRSNVPMDDTIVSISNVWQSVRVSLASGLQINYGLNDVVTLAGNEDRSMTSWVNVTLGLRDHTGVSLE